MLNFYAVMCNRLSGQQPFVFYVSIYTDGTYVYDNVLLIKANSLSSKFKRTYVVFRV